MMPSATNDAAWFYSTIAQSTGALVGVLGALLGGRIVSHLVAMSGRRHEVRSNLRNVASQSNNLLHDQESFIQFAVGDIERDDEAIANKETERDAGTRRVGRPMRTETMVNFRWTHVRFATDVWRNSTPLRRLLDCPS